MVLFLLFLVTKSLVLKKSLCFFAVVLLIIFSCKPTDKTFVSEKDKSLSRNDTVRIANDSLEYEIIIIDPGFNSWFISYAKPRNYYSQSYLESRNRIWVNEWNMRASQPTIYNSSLYEMQINYQQSIDYGYEVNYMLFNYLTYFQLTNRTKLGGFDVRI